MFHTNSFSKNINYFSQVFDLIEDGVIVVGPYGNILYANAFVFDLLKCSTKELINKSYLSINGLNWIKDDFQDSKLVMFKCEVCGRTHWFKVSRKNIDESATVYLMHKEPESSTTKKFNISNLKPLSSKPKSIKLSTANNKSFLKGIFQGIDVGLVLLSNPDLKVMEVNDTYLNLMSQNLVTRDIEGSTYKEYLKNIDSEEAISEAWKDNMPLKKGFIIREVCMKSDTGDKFISYKVQPVKEDGVIKYWLESIIDITEYTKLRKDAVRLAYENQEKINKFRTLLNSMNDGVWVADKKGNIIDANKSAVNMYGFDFKKKDYLLSVKDLNEKVHLRHVDHNPFELENIVTYRALDGQIVNNQEAVLRNIKTGSDLYVSLNASPLYNNDKEIDGAVVVVRDINSRILARKEREELNKLQDEFIAIISHELRTPITVIYSALQTILSLYKKDLTPKLEGFLGKIKQNSLRLLKLINNLLDITKAQAGFIKPNYSNIDIIKLTENVVNLVSFYANSKDIKLVFTSNLKNKVVALDQDKYERIIMNLLSNSIKFTPPKNEIQVKISQHKNNISVSIKDSGIGIPAENLNTIFDRFVQINNVLSRHNEGTGLGLSIVKMLVDSMNGKIKAKSKDGEGSEFIITLPDRIVGELGELHESGQNTENYLVEKVNIEFSDLYFDAK